MRARRYVRKATLRGDRLTVTRIQTSVADLLLTINPEKTNLYSKQQARKITLADIPSLKGEYASQFDQYRILKVVIQYRLHYTPDAFKTQITTSGTGNIDNWASTHCQYMSMVDYDDTSSALLGLKDFEARNGMVNYKTLGNRWVKRVFRPRVNRVVYNTPTTNGYETAKGPVWLDCGYPDIPHYGLKECFFAFENRQPGTQTLLAFGALETRVSMTVQFRHHLSTHINDEYEPVDDKTGDTDAPFHQPYAP